MVRKYVICPVSPTSASFSSSSVVIDIFIETFVRQHDKDERDGECWQNHMSEHDHVRESAEIARHFGFDSVPGHHVDTDGFRDLLSEILEAGKERVHGTFHILRTQLGREDNRGHEVDHVRHIVDDSIAEEVGEFVIDAEHARVESGDDDNIENRGEDAHGHTDPEDMSEFPFGEEDLEEPHAREAGYGPDHLCVREVVVPAEVRAVGEAGALRGIEIVHCAVNLDVERIAEEHVRVAECQRARERSERESTEEYGDSACVYHLSFVAGEHFDGNESHCGGGHHECEREHLDVFPEERGVHCDAWAAASGRSFPLSSRRAFELLELLLRARAVVVVIGAEQQLLLLHDIVAEVGDFLLRQVPEQDWHEHLEREWHRDKKERLRAEPRRERACEACGEQASELICCPHPRDDAASRVRFFDHLRGIASLGEQVDDALFRHADEEEHGGDGYGRARIVFDGHALRIRLEFERTKEEEAGCADERCDNDVVSFLVSEDWEDVTDESEPRFHSPRRESDHFDARVLLGIDFQHCFVVWQHSRCDNRVEKSLDTKVHREDERDKAPSEVVAEIFDEVDSGRERPHHHVQESHHHGSIVSVALRSSSSSSSFSSVSIAKIAEASSASHDAVSQTVRSSCCGIAISITTITIAIAIAVIRIRDIFRRIFVEIIGVCSRSSSCRCMFVH